jgi:hypothetical protein
LGEGKSLSYAFDLCILFLWTGPISLLNKGVRYADPAG